MAGVFVLQKEERESTERGEKSCDTTTISAVVQGARGIFVSSSSILALHDTTNRTCLPLLLLDLIPALLSLSLYLSPSLHLSL